MTQDFFCFAKSDFRRNTVCIARRSDKAKRKKDKSGSVLEVIEQVYIILPYFSAVVKNIIDKIYIKPEDKTAYHIVNKAITDKIESLIKKRVSHSLTHCYYLFYFLLQIINDMVQ